MACTRMIKCGDVLGVPGAWGLLLDWCEISREAQGTAVTTARQHTQCPKHAARGTCGGV